MIIAHVSEEQRKSLKEKNEVVHEGKRFLLVREQINPGDLFWFPFSDTINQMEDVDYGAFNPNNFTTGGKLIPSN